MWVVFCPCWEAEALTSLEPDTGRDHLMRVTELSLSQSQIIMSSNLCFMAREIMALTERFLKQVMTQCVSLNLFCGGLHIHIYLTHFLFYFDPRECRHFRKNVQGLSWSIFAKKSIRHSVFLTTYSCKH